MKSPAELGWRGIMREVHDAPYGGQAQPLGFDFWLALAIGPGGASIFGAELGLWSGLHEWPLWANAVLALWSVVAVAAHRQIIGGIDRLVNR
jgi:hypothetical protein